MIFRAAVLWGLTVITLFGRGLDDVLDRWDERLTFSSENSQVRARASGTLEFEGYWFPQPAPALIDAKGEALFNPRATVFLDVQMGPRLYAFAQARVDHGFDPSQDPLRGRLDEYAIRVGVFDRGDVNIQVGKFATVVGNWVGRHGAWDNPLITAPLAYENLSGVWDQAAARSVNTLLAWSHVKPRAVPGVPAADKYLRLPIVWGPSYATGFAVTGKIGRATYAAEVKNASLSSRPSEWSANDRRWDHPTVSGRIGFLPNQAWNLGVSVSSGSYLLEQARPTLAPGYRLGDYRQTVIAQDLSFAWHHWQVWGEVFEARFEIPRVGYADTVAYYVETKYKITPQL
ncbi:MAG: hypothetical protein ABIV50_15540, partial [Opitutus sp.]